MNQTFFNSDDRNEKWVFYARKQGVRLYVKGIDV